ncbi:hypothetical protein [Streptomyces graminilatus]|uniref:hypothetical protein n=1 Tax=Streptomyces graminilatus TaxID=1464070 RepID=UPI000ACC3897|nr:hypothetical protein [Streptomyces graminilatus]
MARLPKSLGPVELEGYVVAELCEPADESTGLPRLVDAVDEVVGSKVLVGGASGEDVPDGHQDRVFDGNEGSLLAPVTDEPPETGSSATAAT